ncbi:hypothetical protein GLR48_14645 [Loktanella sp. M215]|nr:hypothetical protein [Loktanella sp. M215]
MMARDFTRASRGAAQDIGIWPLLVWAFRTECAQLDLGGGRDRLGHGYGYASMTSIIAQHEQLGCRIDGGGRSDPHPDADLVAAAVAVLPEGCGGARMAVTIAELARAGMMPEWHVPTWIEPLKWGTSRYGRYAVTADAAELGAGGWPHQPYTTRKGGNRFEEVRYCPVNIRGGVAEVTAKRRAWLLWWSALLELRNTFQLGGDLSAWSVTATMPPREPWKVTA